MSCTCAYLKIRPGHLTNLAQESHEVHADEKRSSSRVVWIQAFVMCLSKRDKQFGQKGKRFGSKSNQWKQGVQALELAKYPKPSLKMCPGLVTFLPRWSNSSCAWEKSWTRALYSENRESLDNQQNRKEIMYIYIVTSVSIVCRIHQQNRAEGSAIVKKCWHHDIRRSKKTSDWYLAVSELESKLTDMMSISTTKRQNKARLTIILSKATVDYADLKKRIKEQAPLVITKARAIDSWLSTIWEKIKHVLFSLK